MVDIIRYIIAHSEPSVLVTGIVAYAIVPLSDRTIVSATKLLLHHATSININTYLSLLTLSDYDYTAGVNLVPLLFSSTLSNYYDTYTDIQ